MTIQLKRRGNHQYIYDFSKIDGKLKSTYIGRVGDPEAEMKAKEMKAKVRCRRTAQKEKITTAEKLEQRWAVLLKRRKIDPGENEKYWETPSSLNNYFEGMECHHFLDKLSIGICIPSFIHQIGHSHQQKDFERMRFLNKKVLEWLNEKPQENSQVIKRFTSLLEERFGKNYFD